ncbi:general secretion pathway protein GspA [Enterovibrio norvegicus FF-33]|uniref:AAA family ATPase n=1 Tax=Enterovibrio norvegicus TaxID=188144 RepID=UPI0002E63FAD|nr:AAA family ATPase [Enterovibrio norvegicus]OEE70897.1 general secretion pathway protein GspA [Enterovibrio norvegicus FF-33]
MYQDFFRLTESPFAIVPNPKFYFLSERHKEALSHVLSGIEDGGGLALLTGEVGTGKTTTMKAMLERLPEKTQVATILNPSVSVLELLQSLCDELGLEYREDDSFKRLYDAIADKLFNNESKGIQTILLVDEAQHLMPDVLEQLRLLTNIETSYRKLLKVILIGQPELQQMLRQPNLRQLAQRITARYHLMPLTPDEVHQYITHRISCAGGLEPLFEVSAVKLIAKETGGVPRLINVVCDQSLKLAFRESKQRVNKDIASQACRDVLDWQDASKPAFGHNTQRSVSRYWPYYAGAIGGAALLAIAIRIGLSGGAGDVSPPVAASTATSLPPAAVIVAEPVVEAVTVIESQPAPATVTNRVVEPPANTGSTQPETMTFSALVDESLSAGSAMQALYKLWGFDADVLAASCSKQVRGELACYKSKLPFDQLLTIDRPAVLAMNGPEGSTWFAVLFSKGNKQYELLAGDRRVLVSEAFLKQMWNGEALILWRPPLGNPSAITSSQRGERVRWLEQRLNLVLGSTDPISNQFGLAQRSKVREFQRSNDLDADGIPGPLTFMVLDRVLEMPGPILVNSVNATPSEQALIADGDIVVLPESDVFDVALQSLPEPVFAEPEYVEPRAVPASAPTTKPERRQTEKSNLSKADKDQLTLDDLDLSVLSPELALKVETALSSDKSRTLEAKLQRIQNDIDVVAIADLSADMLNRLPKMDFQTHIYASNAKSRWIKVNNKETREGELVADGVLLRGIEPQQVVVQFENALIAIPALTTW